MHKPIFSVACLTDLGKEHPRSGVDVVEEVCAAVAFVRFRYVPWRIADRAVKSKDCRAYLEQRGYEWISQHFDA